MNDCYYSSNVLLHLHHGSRIGNFSHLQGLVMKIYEKLELLEKSYREMKEIILLRKDIKVVITIGSGKEAQKIILNDDAVK